MEAPTETGIFFSCSHDGCGCRIEVLEACQCPGEGGYRCHCGAPMIPATS